MTLSKMTLAIALVFANQAYAADVTLFDNFTPLTSSSGVRPATSPILLSSPNFTQTIISNSLNNGISQYAPTVANAGSDGNAPDMIDADPSGRYLFIAARARQRRCIAH